MKVLLPLAALAIAIAFGAACAPLGTWVADHRTNTNVFPRGGGGGGGANS